MDYEQILLRLAPCGLDCSRCFRFHDGEVEKLGLKLGKLLEGFEDNAGRLAEWAPQLRSYPQFKEVLDLFQHGECRGCRYGECIFPCNTQDCFKEKGVDFCFQCDEYPCDHPPIARRWRKLNDAMKQIGVEKFYEIQLEVPRYASNWAEILDRLLAEITGNQTSS